MSRRHRETAGAYWWTDFGRVDCDVTKRRSMLGSKELAPSGELRRWFAHDPVKWTEFRKRYRAELARNPAFATLCKMVRSNATVTLLFAAKDAEHNNAVVLGEMLRRSCRATDP